jgi:hypothetical protein
LPGEAAKDLKQDGNLSQEPVQNPPKCLGLQPPPTEFVTARQKLSAMENSSMEICSNSELPLKVDSQLISTNSQIHWTGHLNMSDKSGWMLSHSPNIRSKERCRGCFDNQL